MSHKKQAGLKTSQGTNTGYPLSMKNPINPKPSVTTWHEQDHSGEDAACCAVDKGHGHTAASGSCFFCGLASRSANFDSKNFLYAIKTWDWSNSYPSKSG